MAYDTLSLNMDKIISLLEGGISEVEKELNKKFLEQQSEVPSLLVMGTPEDTMDLDSLPSQA